MLFRQFSHHKLMVMLGRKTLQSKMLGREVRLQPKTGMLNPTFTLSRWQMKNNNRQLPFKIQLRIGEVETCLNRPLIPSQRLRQLPRMRRDRTMGQLMSTNFWTNIKGTTETTETKTPCNRESSEARLPWSSNPRWRKPWKTSNLLIRSSPIFRKRSRLNPASCHSGPLPSRNRARRN